MNVDNHRTLIESGPMTNCKNALIKSLNYIRGININPARTVSI